MFLIIVKIRSSICQKFVKLQFTHNQILGKSHLKLLIKLFQVDTKTTQHVPETTSAKRGAAAPQNQILVSRTTASAAMESADSSVTNVCILKLVQ